MAGKSEQAFRTIGELAGELGIPQHILRYWETRFPQLRPLQRAGNRRYYRPEDVALARRIHRLLNQEGYTVRGVQRVLEEKEGRAPVSEPAPVPAALAPQPAASAQPAGSQAMQLDALQALRGELARALEETRI
jgi:DNA-binding transcriptional MerR regulator